LAAAGEHLSIVRVAVYVALNVAINANLRISTETLLKQF
jgi:hypothetical protein